MSEAIGIEMVNIHPSDVRTIMIPGRGPPPSHADPSISHFLYSSNVVNKTNGCWHCEMSVKKPPPGLTRGSAKRGLAKQTHTCKRASDF